MTDKGTKNLEDVTRRLKWVRDILKDKLSDDEYNIIRIATEDSWNDGCFYAETEI